ncbi:cupredoxin domain-containing protein [Lentilactobacillus parakefiri]|uniref:Copper-binding protein n=1 Tax=Lentilactobacillus parakefiri TaxID=152332 RepID=A0A269Y3L5_9LACO|nr:cupredoxin domain-containing protein [Lentilactobacillus parakefiri]PAK80142.1 copper-binding protein [Lentilactobacillus parakefiri]
MNEDKQTINVTVSGGYQPSVIKLKQGVPAEIKFKRINDQGCLDVVHSDELGFSEALPVNVTKTVQVPTDKVGEFGFSCGMDMFKGKVEVE